MLCYVFTFPTTVIVGASNLIVSIPGPSFLTCLISIVLIRMLSDMESHLKEIGDTVSKS